MRIKLLFIFLFVLPCFIYAKETGRSTSFSENGEKIITINYKKEKSGLFKRELYGNKFFYTKVIDYYSEKNEKFLDKVERYFVLERKNGELKSHFDCKYYQNENPNKILREEIAYNYDGKYSLITCYYSSVSNMKPIKTTFVMEGEKYISESNEYTGREDGLEKSVISYDYEKKGNILSMENSYSIPNPKNMNRELIGFADDGTVQFRYIDHSDNPEGLLSTFIKATPEGLMHECIHNPKYNPEGYTKVIALTDFDEKPIVIQFLFEENLYEGKAYMVESRYDSNGNVISRTYHDKNGDEIKLD